MINIDETKPYEICDYVVEMHDSRYTYDDYKDGTVDTVYNYFGNSWENMARITGTCKKQGNIVIFEDATAIDCRSFKAYCPSFCLNDANDSMIKINGIKHQCAILYGELEGCSESGQLKTDNILDREYVKQFCGSHIFSFRSTGEYFKLTRQLDGYLTMKYAILNTMENPLRLTTYYPDASSIINTYKKLITDHNDYDAINAPEHKYEVRLHDGKFSDTSENSDTTDFFNNNELIQRLHRGSKEYPHYIFFGKCKLIKDINKVLFEPINYANISYVDSLYPAFSIEGANDCKIILDDKIVQCLKISAYAIENGERNEIIQEKNDHLYRDPKYRNKNKRQIDGVMRLNYAYLDENTIEYSQYINLYNNSDASIFYTEYRNKTISVNLSNIDEHISYNSSYPIYDFVNKYNFYYDDDDDDYDIDNPFYCIENINIKQNEMITHAGELYCCSETFILRSYNNKYIITSSPNNDSYCIFKRRT